jgi:hypothetical protein
MKLSRKQARETLETIPNEILFGKSVSKELTHKQRTFARRVAEGATKAQAYRDAYKANATKRTLSAQPYALMRDERITREIQAYELAIESAKYRSPIALRELVIQSLVQTLIDPETKQAQKVAAAKVLGTVAEVSAFVDRKEITHVSSSEHARDQIMSALSDMLKANAIDVDPTSLIQELGGTHPSPTPLDAESESRPHVHTIPHESSVSQPIPHDLPNSQPIDTPTPSKISDQESDK